MSMKIDGTVGTLGKNSNDVTCSVLATKSLDGDFTISGFDEFELAAEALVAGNIEAMVVPGAYPHISKFIMNEQLAVLDVFTYIIPPLVFASKYLDIKNKYNILYNHPATNPLINNINGTRWDMQENVSSNTIACLKVLENDHISCAITNAACAEKYGLSIHQVIRAGIKMPFVIFKKE